MNEQLLFGEWLEDQLKKRKWSQKAFAETIGVARTTVGAWIGNVQPPRRRACRDIAKVLEVDLNEVLVRAGYPPQDPDYQLPEHRPEEPDLSGIDLSDPALSFFTSHGGELTDEEKQAVIEVARIILRNKQRAQREG